MSAERKLIPANVLSTIRYTIAGAIKGQSNAVKCHQVCDLFKNDMRKLARVELLAKQEPGVLAFLQWFDPIGGEGIPSDSILREFIGGSILENFEPWQQ